jgi:hypothetical protein
MLGMAGGRPIFGSFRPLIPTGYQNLPTLRHVDGPWGRAAFGTPAFHWRRRPSNGTALMTTTSGEARHDSDWPTNGELLGQRVRRVHIGLLETAHSTKGSSDGTVVALLLSLARLFWCTTPFSRWLPGGHGYKGQWLSRG